ncbi:MAG TPA: DUF2946 family protein [Burkholderiaceae bacterium]|nr:DUF2946 family protein [Burkholderiaceae bacterium]
MLRAFGKRFVYLLVAALLLAQHGAALHALAHGVDALRSASQESPDKRAPLGERHCDLCLTYAQVAAGAAPAAPPLLSAALEYVVPQTQHHSTGAQLTRTYQSRAPPRTV